MDFLHAISNPCSSLRTRFINRVFFELGLIEQWGSGVPVILEETPASNCRRSSLKTSFCAFGSLCPRPPHPLRLRVSVDRRWQPRPIGAPGPGSRLRLRGAQPRDLPASGSRRDRLHPAGDAQRLSYGLEQQRGSRQGHVRPPQQTGELGLGLEGPMLASIDRFSWFANSFRDAERFCSREPAQFTRSC